MKATEPLALHHSWPLVDVATRFDLGRVHATDGAAWSPGAPPRRLDVMAGVWSCDLVDNRLSWSSEVHRLFGLPAGHVATRAASLACYAESSRAAMERLRRYAIRHRRGFTLDIEISPIGGSNRWLRLVAAPVSEGGRVVCLHGYKADVSALYRSR